MVDVIPSELGQDVPAMSQHVLVEVVTSQMLNNNNVAFSFPSTSERQELITPSQTSLDSSKTNTDCNFKTISFTVFLVAVVILVSYCLAYFFWLPHQKDYHKCINHNEDGVSYAENEWILFKKDGQFRCLKFVIGNVTANDAEDNCHRRFSDGLSGELSDEEVIYVNGELNSSNNKWLTEKVDRKTVWVDNAKKKSAGLLAKLDTGNRSEEMCKMLTIDSSDTAAYAARSCSTLAVGFVCKMSATRMSFF